MRAAAFTELIGPEGVEVIERDDPEPGDGEAVVDVRACSINRHDLWILQNDSPLVGENAVPFVSGLDVAGVVSEAGSGAGVSEGDRVVLCPNQTCGECQYCREGPENLCQAFMLYHGGFAEKAKVEGSRLVPIPDDMSFEKASALPTAYLTAWHMFRKADVSAGDLLFVPGATGGVGVAAVQLANATGARTIGTSTSAEKIERLEEIGCDHTVQSADPDEIVGELHGFDQVDAVINHLSGEFTKLGLRLMKRGGTQVICGGTADTTNTFSTPPFFLNQQEVVGSTMGTQPELEKLVELVDEGAFDPVIYETYPLEETGDAFADLQDRDAFGKLIIEPTG